MSIERKHSLYGAPKEARTTVGLGAGIAVVLLVVGHYLNSNSGLLGRGSTVLVLILCLLGAGLAARGRYAVGALVLMIAVIIQMSITPLLTAGVGVSSAITAMALLGIIGILAMPPEHVGRALLTAMLSGVAILLIDVFSPLNREAVGSPWIQWLGPVISSAAFGILFARRYRALGIRTKIVLGILATGGLSLVVFGYFALSRAGEMVRTLSGRLETSVRLLAEEQLINTVFTEADRANDSFRNIMDDLVGLSEYWGSLHANRSILGQGAYWDAASSLITLEDGQRGNSIADTSGVFVPTDVRVTPALISELNTSAYLDFYAPAILELRPSLLAIYAIDTDGVIRYFPNINLASLLPPDYEATKRPYFVISSPLFNPHRLPRWSIPYVDPARRGLVVTVANPVYMEDRFRGVVAADMALDETSAQIRTLRIGRTGFAYMIDSSGLIISMPPQGFELFNMQPDVITSDEFFKETLLGRGTDELQTITRRMVAGGSGLLIIEVDGVDTYVSFAPITANGYSVALVVPVDELQGAIRTARTETQAQIQSALQIAALMFLGLLIAAVAISVVIGQVIASPIISLTRTADQIVAGDLAAQANIVSQDEIGALAAAFNTMTSRLRGLLGELEERVAKRTSELELAKENIERRASRFESVARITGMIGASTDVDELLIQITYAISKEFGFFHVGLFLIDPASEFAVLSAASGEGAQQLLARNHKVKVVEQEVISRAISSGKPHISSASDGLHAPNVELSGSRTEIALPLRAGNEVIGVLDVHSTEVGAFDAEDIHILTTLADHVSIALRNAEQHEETRRALAESDFLSRQFIQSGWREFTSATKIMGVRHTGARAKLLYDQPEEASTEGQVAFVASPQSPGGGVLTMPVSLRGEVIGTLMVRSPADRSWDQDELEVVSAIIDRAAFALENARLLAESRRRAAKEAKIGEVTSRISASINLRNVLQTAVEELGRALPGSEITLELGRANGEGGSMSKEPKPDA